MWRAIDGKEQRTDIPLWEDFVQNAESMIEYINDRIPCTSDYMDGKTRSQVFAENLPPEEQIRRPSKEMLQKALQKGEVRLVHRNGITIEKVNFWHPDVFEFIGRKVRVYKNLLDPNEITVATLDGELICVAKANYFKETQNLEEDIERLEGARKSLTEIAKLGSGEVNIAPEFNTMVEAARHAYANRQLEGVNSFLEDQPKELQARKFVLSPKKSALKTPFEGV